MVHGHHVIFSAYGFWLPNDPRGSWSKTVACWELLRFGPATKVTTRRSVARRAHDVRARVAAKQALKYPPVVFTGRQALAVSHGFAQALDEGRYIAHACSILPEHIHFVIAQHPRDIHRIVGHLRTRATQHLGSEGLWPDPERPVWGGRGWNVFLNSPEEMRRAIAYVEANPAKEGKRPQKWPFVVPYAG